MNHFSDWLTTRRLSLYSAARDRGELRADCDVSEINIRIAQMSLRDSAESCSVRLSANLFSWYIRPDRQEVSFGTPILYRLQLALANRFPIPLFC